MPSRASKPSKATWEKADKKDGRDFAPSPTSLLKVLAALAVAFAQVGDELANLPIFTGNCLRKKEGNRQQKTQQGRGLQKELPVLPTKKMKLIRARQKNK